MGKTLKVKKVYMWLPFKVKCNGKIINKKKYISNEYCLYLVEPLLLQHIPPPSPSIWSRKPKTLDYSHIINIYISINRVCSLQLYLSRSGIKQQKLCQIHKIKPHILCQKSNTKMVNSSKIRESNFRIKNCYIWRFTSHLIWKMMH